MLYLLALVAVAGWCWLMCGFCVYLWCMWT